MTQFRTRQAPSPTGYLHFGTARQILFTKLLAKANEGVWYLRVEDTDRSRLQPDAVGKMLKSIKKLGLLPDEGVTSEKNGEKDLFYGVYQKGDYGPYIQSERLKLYHEHAQKLIDKKLAYWSYLTDEDKQELTEIKSITKKSINYHKFNLEKFGEESLYVDVKTALSDERKPALRYHIQREGQIECYDELMGKTTFDLSLEEDFNILKSDGYPTYHLAHLVDDHLMKTTLVCRAQEWYPSLARHVTMFRDYWGREPKYLHTPFIMGETGHKKLSKRDAKVDIEDYLLMGYLPEAVVNYLAFLGWNPGSEKELYLDPEDFEELPQEQRLERLIDNIAQEFSLDKLSKSPARFSLEKLNWFNREYIKMLSLAEFSLLASENKLIQKHEKGADAKLRMGDYVYLVDEEKREVFCETNAEKPGVENTFHPVGGGREKGLDYLENIKKEVFEETNDQFNVNPEKLKWVAKFNLLNGGFLYDQKRWDGKIFNVYYHPVKKEQIKTFTEVDKNNGNREIHFDWTPLNKVIETNEYTTYPIWRKFCRTNEVACFSPTSQVKSQYLAWYLDKQRITTLSEIGTDSDCVVLWKKPKKEEIKWKKITEEQSLECLEKIYNEVILKNLENEELLSKKSSLYELSTKTKSIKELNDIFEGLVSFWESEIKNWLQIDGKDVGSHLWPLRVTLSGKAKSPSPFELLTILQNDQIKKRIEAVLGK